MNTFREIVCIKKAYSNQEDANLAACRMMEFVVSNVKVYLCPICQDWHLGIDRK
jgi:hypothetical protein